MTAGMVALEMMDLAGEGAPAEAGRAWNGAASAKRGGAVGSGKATAGSGAAATGDGAGRRPPVAATATGDRALYGGGADGGTAAAAGITGEGEAAAGHGDEPAAGHGGGGGISPGSDLVVATCRLARLYRREPIKLLYDSLHG